MKLMLAALALSTSAPEKTSWYEQCAQGSFTCYGYIQGIYETARATKAICAPDEFNAPDMAKYMITFMDAAGNEDTKTMSFSGLVIAALESDYPCK